MLRKWILVLVTALSLFAGVAFADQKINLNTATEAQLESLNGVGVATANAIIKYRKSHHGFKSVDELTAVKGIGAKKLSKLQSQLTVSD